VRLGEGRLDPSLLKRRHIIAAKRDKLFDDEPKRVLTLGVYVTPHPSIVNTSQPGVQIKDKGTTHIERKIYYALMKNEKVKRHIINHTFNGTQLKRSGVSPLSIADVILCLQQGDIDKVFVAIQYTDVFKSLTEKQRSFVTKILNMAIASPHVNSNLFFRSAKQFVGIIIWHRFRSLIELVENWPNNIDGVITSDNLDLNGLLDFEDFTFKTVDRDQLVSGFTMNDLTILYGEMMCGIYMLIDDVFTLSLDEFIEEAYKLWSRLLTSDFQAVYNNRPEKLHKQENFDQWYRYFGLTLFDPMIPKLDMYENYDPSIPADKLMDHVQIRNLYTSNLPVTVFGLFGSQRTYAHSFVTHQKADFPSYRFDPVVGSSPVRMQSDCIHSNCLYLNEDVKHFYDANTVEYYKPMTIGNQIEVDQSGYVAETGTYPTEFLRHQAPEQPIRVYDDIVQFAKSEFQIEIRNIGEPTDNIDRENLIVLEHWLFKPQQNKIRQNFAQLCDSQSRTPGPYIGRLLWHAISGFIKLTWDQYSNNTGVTKLVPYKFSQFGIRDGSKSPGLPFTRNGAQKQLFAIISGVEDTYIEHATHGVTSGMVQQILKPPTVQKKDKTRGIAGMNALTALVGKSIFCPIRHLHMIFVGGNSPYQIGNNPMKFPGRMTSFLEYRDWIFDGQSWIKYKGKTLIMSYDFPSWDKLTTQEAQFLYGYYHYAATDSMTEDVYKKLIYEFINAVPTYHVVDKANVCFKMYSLNSGNTRTADGNCFIHQYYWCEALLHWLLSKQDSELKNFRFLIKLKNDIFESIDKNKPLVTDPELMFLTLYSIAPNLILSDDGVMLIREGLIEVDDFLKFYKQRGYVFTGKYYVSDCNIDEFLSSHYMQNNRFRPEPNPSRIMSAAVYGVPSHSDDPVFLAAKLLSLAQVSWPMRSSKVYTHAQRSIPLILLEYAKKISSEYENKFELLLKYLSGYDNFDPTGINDMRDLYSHDRLNRMMAMGEYENDVIDMNNRYIESMIPDYHGLTITSTIAHGKFDHSRIQDLKPILKNVMNEPEASFIIRAVQQHDTNSEFTLLTPRTFAIDLFKCLWTKYYGQPVARVQTKIKPTRTLNEAAIQAPIRQTICFMCANKALYYFHKLKLHTCGNYGGLHFKLLSRIPDCGLIRLGGCVDLECNACGSRDFTKLSIYRGEKKNFIISYCKSCVPKTGFEECYSVLPLFKNDGDWPEDIIPYKSFCDFIASGCDLKDCKDIKLLADHIPFIRETKPYRYICLYNVYRRTRETPSPSIHTLVFLTESYFELVPPLKGGQFKPNKMFKFINGNTVKESPLHILRHKGRVVFTTVHNIGLNKDFLMEYKEECDNSQLDSYTCTSIMKQFLTQEFKDCSVKRGGAPDGNSSQAFEDALSLCKTSDIGFVQGPPGTGKSFLLGKIAAHYLNLNLKIAVFAYSHNIVDDLGDTFVNRYPTYIRLASRVYPFNGEHKVRSRLPRYEPGDRSRIIFSTLATNTRFSADVILIDEYSMVSDDFLFNIFSRITSDCKVYCFGDHKQNIPRVPEVLISNGCPEKFTTLLSLVHKLDVQKSKFLVTLTRSYRLNRETLLLINSHYNGRLDICERPGCIDVFVSKYSAHYVGDVSFNEHACNIAVRLYSRLKSSLMNAYILTTLAVAKSVCSQQLIKNGFPDYDAGVLDAVQGREFDNTILLIPNSSSFSCNPNRINVGLSRHKYRIMIIASQDVLDKQFWWPTFLELRERYPDTVKLHDASIILSTDDEVLPTVEETHMGTYDYTAENLKIMDDNIEIDMCGETNIFVYPDYDLREFKRYAKNLLLIKVPQLSQEQINSLLIAVNRYEVQCIKYNKFVCTYNGKDNRSNNIRVLKQFNDMATPKPVKDVPLSIPELRVKNAIARAKKEVLKDVNGVVLDLGSGRGQDMYRYPIEAKLIFVENDQAVLPLLRKNVDTINAVRHSEHTVVKCDYQSCLIRDCNDVKDIDPDIVVCFMSLQTQPFGPCVFENLVLGKECLLIIPCPDVLEHKWRTFSIEKINDTCYTFDNKKWKGTEHVIDYDGLIARMGAKGFSMEFNKALKDFSQSNYEELNFWRVLKFKFNESARNESAVKLLINGVEAYRPVRYNSPHIRALNKEDMKKVHESDLFFTDTECISPRRPIKFGNIPAQTVVLGRKHDCQIIPLMNSFYRNFLETTAKTTLDIKPREYTIFGLNPAAQRRIRQGYDHCTDTYALVMERFLRLIPKYIFQRPVFVHYGGRENDIAFLHRYVKEPGPCVDCGSVGLFYTRPNGILCIAHYRAVSKTGKPPEITAFAGAETFDLQTLFDNTSLGSHVPDAIQEHSAYGDAVSVRNLYYTQTDLTNFREFRDLPTYESARMKADIECIKLCYNLGNPLNGGYLLSDYTTVNFGVTYNYSIKPPIDIQCLQTPKVKQYTYNYNNIRQIDLIIPNNASENESTVVFSEMKIEPSMYPRVVSQVECIRHTRYSSFRYNSLVDSFIRYQCYITRELDVDLNDKLYYGGMLVVITDKFDDRLIEIAKKFYLVKIFKLFGYLGYDVCILYDRYLYGSCTVPDSFREEFEITRTFVNRSPPYFIDGLKSNIISSIFYTEQWEKVIYNYNQYALCFVYRLDQHSNASYKLLLNLIEKYSPNVNAIVNGTISECWTIDKFTFAQLELTELTDFIKHVFNEHDTVKQFYGAIVQDQEILTCHSECPNRIEVDSCLYYDFNTVAEFGNIEIDDAVNTFVVLLPIQNTETTFAYFQRIGFSVGFLSFFKDKLTAYNVFKCQRGIFDPQQFKHFLYLTTRVIVHNYIVKASIGVSESLQRHIIDTDPEYDFMLQRNICIRSKRFFSFFHIYVYELTRSPAVLEYKTTKDLSKFFNGLYFSSETRYRAMTKTLETILHNHPLHIQKERYYCTNSTEHDISLFCDVLNELGEI